MKKDITIIGVSLILLFVGFSGCFEQKTDDTNPDNQEPSETNMNFSFTECGVFDFDESETGINETLWLNDTTLNVKVNILINCAEEITNGSYEIDDDILTLKYKSPECIPEECMDCMCGIVLYYNFTNLKNEDYQFQIERIN